MYTVPFLGTLIHKKERKDGLYQDRRRCPFASCPGSFGESQYWATLLSLFGSALFGWPNL